ncbi:MAG: EthD domain-containing protein [Acidimicrobiia bacterium]
MGWVGVVWGPELDAIERLAPVWSRHAIDDQGPYARATPFDVMLGGEVLPGDVEWSTLGARVLAWSVDQRTLLDPPTPPAVAMVSLMRRNPALTHDAFVAHWRDRHGPLALRRHVGLVEYRQGVVAANLTPDAPDAPEIDGVAQLGFSTRIDFETRFFDSDEGRAEIMADVARFMDRPGPETTLVGPPRSH